MTGSAPNALARTVRQFFSTHLPNVRGASRHTIDSYRYALLLLLRFLAATRHRSVADLDLPDIAAEDVLAFLDDLERARHNTAATRNVRLAALHAFFRYAAASAPEQLARSQQILLIPFKRADQRPMDYLEYAELQAVLEAVDRSTAAGRRDYALLAILFNTGARVQEILDLRPGDLHLDKPFQVRLFGKGRKERMCPLWPQTATLLRALCQRATAGPPGHRAPLRQSASATADAFRRWLYPGEIPQTRASDCAEPEGQTLASPQYAA